MKTFSFPGGRSWVSVKSSRPDPASRFELYVSDGTFVSAQDLIEAGKFLIATGKEAIKDDDAPDLAEVLAPNAEGNATIVVTENT